jgi:hypothetical protein
MMNAFRRYPRAVGYGRGAAALPNCTSFGSSPRRRRPRIRDGAARQWRLLRHPGSSPALRVRRTSRPGFVCRSVGAHTGGATRQIDESPEAREGVRMGRPEALTGLGLSLGDLMRTAV